MLFWAQNGHFHVIFARFCMILHDFHVILQDFTGKFKIFPAPGPPGPGPRGKIFFFFFSRLSNSTLVWFISGGKNVTTFRGRDFSRFL